MEAIKRYNKLMYSIGVDHKTIGTPDAENTEGWSIEDMVSEVLYWRSLFFEEGNEFYYYRQTNPRAARNDLARMDRFINRYQKADAVY